MLEQGLRNPLLPYYLSTVAILVGGVIGVAVISTAVECRPRRVGKRNDGSGVGFRGVADSGNEEMFASIHRFLRAQRSRTRK